MFWRRRQVVVAALANKSKVSKVVEKDLGITGVILEVV
jgi:hypothetical protein